MDDGLRELGARAHLFDRDGNDLGFCHLPRPVWVGDLAVLEDATFRVLSVVDDLDPAAAIDVLVAVEPVRKTVVSGS
jgi:hypothetical protein